MDIDVVKILTELGGDGVTIILVYILWRRSDKRDAALIECLINKGVISKETIDTLDEVK